MYAKYDNYGVLNHLYSTISETPKLIERESHSQQWKETYKMFLLLSDFSHNSEDKW
jgi:hypothetical protein